MMADIINPKIIVEWFMQRGLDSPCDTRKGNTKIQKLLFFAQLIYMCKNNGEVMYEEQFRAFENGMVLESIRLSYRDEYKDLKKESKLSLDIPKKVQEALEITEDIFGNCDAEELSELSYQFDAWSKYLKISIEDSKYHNKEKAIVPYEELEKELYKMNRVLKAYEKRNLVEEEEDY